MRNPHDATQAGALLMLSLAIALFGRIVLLPVLEDVGATFVVAALGFVAMAPACGRLARPCPRRSRPPRRR